MKIFATCFIMLCAATLLGQRAPSPPQRNAIVKLIDSYSQARETRDTILLKTILTADIDQLVSTGEWRVGISTAIKGMQRSSANNPGSRTLTIDKIRLISPTSAIVDCKYDIKTESGSIRNMWSTFIVIDEKKVWKIAAIRNMFPAAQ